MNGVLALFDRASRSAADRLHALRSDDRGDVPGWVMITIMTAGIVVALWALAGPRLVELFTTALNSVTGP